MLLLAIDCCKADRLKCSFGNHTIEKYDALPASAVQYGCEVIELASRDIKSRNDVEGTHYTFHGNIDVRSIKISK